MFDTFKMHHHVDSWPLQRIKIRTYIAKIQKRVLQLIFRYRKLKRKPSLFALCTTSSIWYTRLGKRYIIHVRNLLMQNVAIWNLKRKFCAFANIWASRTIFNTQNIALSRDSQSQLCPFCTKNTMQKKWCDTFDNKPFFVKLGKLLACFDIKPYKFACFIVLGLFCIQEQKLENLEQ